MCSFHYKEMGKQNRTIMRYSKTASFGKAKEDFPVRSHPCTYTQLHKIRRIQGLILKKKKKNRYKVTDINHHPGFHLHHPLRPGPGSLEDKTSPQHAVARQSSSALALGPQGVPSPRHAESRSRTVTIPLAQRRPGGAGTQGVPPRPGNTRAQGSPAAAPRRMRP